MTASNETEPPSNGGLGGLTSGPENDPKAWDAIQALEGQLAEERDSRRQERFLFILTGIIVGDIIAFSFIENWSGPIAIVILEVIFLIVLGRMCGVEDISMLMTRMLHRAGDKLTKD